MIAVEQDTRCIAALNEVASRFPGRLRVIEGDALRVDPAGIAEREGSFRIVANLPYNVGTALLTRWIETASWPPRWDRLVLMFQREVAERIVATPQERAAYGRLGVLCGWRTEARILFDVSPAAFTPPPKVTSSVVELRPRRDPLPCPAPILSALTQAAFGQRRKMMRQSLRTLPPLNGRGVDAALLLERGGIEPTRRPEEIDVAGFVALARAWIALTESAIEP